MTRYVGLRELCVLNNNQKGLNRLHFSWLRCPLEDPFLREYATREPRRGDSEGGFDAATRRQAIGSHRLGFILHNFSASF